MFKYFCKNLYFPFTFVLIVTSNLAQADALVQWMFWHEMGNQVGNAVSSHNDYRRQRQHWKNKIAEAKRELEQCGGCDAAKEKLKKWQGVENQFQDVAGRLLAAAGTNPQIAKWLDIDLPPARGYSQKELDARRVQRPGWIDERPDFCKAPSEDHIKCLQDYQRKHSNLVDLTFPVSLGAQCYETSKFYNACRDEDYEGFKRELNLKNARDSGLIIPDFKNDNFGPLVYYGMVPDNFMPDPPPVNVIIDTLNEKPGYKAVARISYRMYKNSPGQLVGLSINYFTINKIFPESKCQSLERHNLPQSSKRVCDDFNELEYEYKYPTLHCLYSQTGGMHEERADQAVYWYSERPPLADPKRLYERSSQHELLRVVDPRTTCPATKAEADAIESEYWTRLTSIKESTKQIAEDVVLPKPEKTSKRKEQAKENYKKYKRAKDATRKFPVEGKYSFALTYNEIEQNGECQLIKTQNALNYRYHCTDVDGIEISGRATTAWGALALEIPGSYINIRDEILSFSVLVDIDEYDRGNKTVLTGSSFDKKGSLTMNKDGMLKDIKNVNYAGNYNFRLSSETDTLIATCKLGYIDLYKGKRYEMNCTTDSGDKYQSELILDQENSNTIQVVGWYPKRYVIDGQQIEELYFILDPDSAGDVTLKAYADRNISGILTKGEIRADKHLVASNKKINEQDVQPENSTKITQNKIFTGQWSGHLVCSNNEIKLDITLNDWEAHWMYGRLDFEYTDPNNEFKQGGYFIYGNHSVQSGTFELKPAAWISRPDVFPALILAGEYKINQIQPDQDRKLSGLVFYPDCDSFEVTQISDEIDGLESVPSQIRTKLLSEMEKAKTAKGNAMLNK